mmetsp:Transcript_3307/g.3630  ORF Transcript_3307/g.3630 Transcript_3307/m.3630 type:complete len:80 (-) Transcript_3307:255-494(-)
MVSSMPLIECYFPDIPVWPNTPPRLNNNNKDAATCGDPPILNSTSTTYTVANICCCIIRTGSKVEYIEYTIVVVRIEER